MLVSSMASNADPRLRSTPCSTAAASEGRTCCSTFAVIRAGSSSIIATTSAGGSVSRARAASSGCARMKAQLSASACFAALIAQQLDGGGAVNARRDVDAAAVGLQHDGSGIDVDDPALVPHHAHTLTDAEGLAQVMGADGIGNETFRTQAHGQRRTTQRYAQRHGC